jgi:hypothetical protein
MVMVLVAIYLFLTRRHSQWENPTVWRRRLPYNRTKNSRANSWKGSHKILIIAPSAQIHIVDGGHFALDTATEIATSR